VIFRLMINGFGNVLALLQRFEMRWTLIYVHSTHRILITKIPRRFEISSLKAIGEL